MRRTTITWERGAGFNRTTLSVNEAFDPRARSLYVDQYDTFISHKGDDIDLAIRVGNTLYKCGLHGYLDVWDPKVDGDDPELEVHLRDVIRPSPSLLAVVSENTNLSWWVPFEIGVARETESVIASLLSVNENSPTTVMLPQLPQNLANFGVIPRTRNMGHRFSPLAPYRRRQTHVDRKRPHVRGTRRRSRDRQADKDRKSQIRELAVMEPDLFGKPIKHIDTHRGSPKGHYVNPLGRELTPPARFQFPSPPE